MNNSDTISRLLQELRAGRSGAMDDLIPLVYEELRRTAHRELAHRRPGQTLDTSALVHEAYMKLAGPNPGPWEGRAHLFAVAATAMRHIIIDHVLKHRTAKRGGGRRAITFDEQLLVPEQQAEELVGLNAALERLGQLEPRLARVVDCRFFAGLTVSETAKALGTSPRTVDRDWQKAKAWLYRELRDD